MASTIDKAGKSRVILVKDNKNDDLPDSSESPLVCSPCCRLPRENISQAEVSSSAISATMPLLMSTAAAAAASSINLSSSRTREENNEKMENFNSKDPSTMKKSMKIIVNKSAKKIDDIIVDNTVPMDLKPSTIVVPSSKRIPIIERSSANFDHPTNVAVPRRGASRPAPAPANLEEPPLILAIHLVPSLPISLFEILAEIIEAATGKAVVILHEARVDRPVAKHVNIDIAILPASEDWDEGSLLPVSFVFEHRLNKEKKPAVYADVVVARDCMRNIQEILDLRGYRCAIPDRRKALGAAGLLFSYLKSKGENPSFFGNTLDSGSQLEALRMIAGKQAEVGILESPVINCHKNTLPGVHSLDILATLGPLPPYRIMINKKFQASLRDKIKEDLLNVERDEAWMERLRPFGVTGFAEYSEDIYDLEQDMKSVVTSVPYY